jgi:hypothetical protein
MWEVRAQHLQTASHLSSNIYGKCGNRTSQNCTFDFKNTVKVFSCSLKPHTHWDCVVLQKTWTWATQKPSTYRLHKKDNSLNRRYKISYQRFHQNIHPVHIYYKSVWKGRIYGQNIYMECNTNMTIYFWT